MNLGIKAAQKEQLKILDSKTDSQGNTIYQVFWLKDSQMSWEPLS